MSTYICRKRLQVQWLVGLLLVAMVGEVSADRYWITNGDGAFSDTANWSSTSGGAGGFSVPGPGDLTFFQVSGASPYTVGFSSGGDTNSLTVLNNPVTFDLNGNTYWVNQSSTGDIAVTANGGGTASLRVTDGTLRQVNPPGSTNVNNFVRVRGDASSGGATLSIDGAAAVLWTGQTAIGIAGSSAAKSRLEVVNSGTYHSISDANVGGATAGGPGSVVVSGSGSLLTAYSLGLGTGFASTLDVNSGATLRLRSAAGFGSAGLRIGFVGVATINNGTIELNGSGGNMLFNHGTLQGNGTIQRAAGASGLSNIRQESFETGNFSRIRPGDVLGTPAVGSIQIEDANLTLATFGPAGSQQQIALDLASPTTYDQILLTDPGVNDGVVTATLGGSILFNNLSAINFTGSVFLDFVRAENIVNGGYTTNIASAAAGWTYNGGDPLFYTLGIASVGVNDVRFRLFVVPEPSSALLVLLMAPLMSRRRRRHL